MCTLTILREDDRALVTMNRDDMAERDEAPPALWPNAEPAFLAPRDLQAGGTWFGVNRHGVIACLLNRYDTAPIGKTSRGNIVLEAMGGATIEAACRVLAALDHRAYSPFTCIVITQDAAARLDWTGSNFGRGEIPVGDDLVIATSSSWQFEEVKAKREALFREICSNGGDAAGNISSFHTQRASENDAWAPMMLRPKTRTKSVTQVEVAPHGVEMRYWTRDAAIARGLTAPLTRVRIQTEFAAEA